MTQDQQTFVTADMPFTVSRVETLESIKGSMRTGDIIPIVETGGVYSPYLNGDIKQGVQPQKVEMTIEGVTVMRPNETYILFIQRNEKSSIENAYNVLGIYQGKYKVQDGTIQRGASIGKSEVHFEFKSVKDIKAKIKEQQSEIADCNR